VSFEAVFAGGAHTCALTSIPGAAYCWGRGESGQLGVPPPATTCLTDGGPYSCSMVPVPVGGGLTFETLAGGGAHTCALTVDGAAYCWGNNAYGQLGDGSTTNRNVPVQVAGGLTFASIDAGASHTCALTSVGNAYCWGRNNRGQLGNGTTNGSTVPVAVTGSMTFQFVAAGGFSIGHTCALTAAGAGFCWGENEKGQVGDGTTRDRSIPRRIAGGLTFLSIDAGFRHSCGRANTGTVYCWGSSGAGQLGNDTNSMSTVPAKVFGQP